MRTVAIGVLALQGGFAEHLASLHRAAAARTAAASGLADSGAVAASGPGSGSGPSRTTANPAHFSFTEVRTPEQLSLCDALVIPGGESTTLSLVAAQSGLLEPLRDFVKKYKRPTWGTCAGLIFLSEEASSTKRGGQELIGGLDVRVHRNHFGRQIESFVTDLQLPFLDTAGRGNSGPPFPAVFIRAPVVECLLSKGEDGSKSVPQTDSQEPQTSQPKTDSSSSSNSGAAPVEILAILPGRHANNEKEALAGQKHGQDVAVPQEGPGDIVALRQGNVLGMSFHPELTDDTRIHAWWLDQVVEAVSRQGR